MRVDIKERVGQYLSQLTHFLGREPYERCDNDVNHRNGTYERSFTLKKLGEVEVNIPRVRNGEFSTKILPRSKRYEDSIREDLCMMFLTGISTRSLALISKKQICRKISPQEVGNSSKGLIEAVESWRNRDLSGEKIKYLFLDGVNFRMGIGKSIELVPVLVAIGVTHSGHKLVLGFQAGDRESAASWREFFKDLKRRGKKGKDITLRIMDGLQGLEKVFKEEFLKAKVQRCQVHIARNVLAKVPRKFKKMVADDVRSIFYASSKEKAISFFTNFKNKWERELPSGVKCLEKFINSCLTFLNIQMKSGYLSE